MRCCIQPLPYAHADRLVMVWQDLRRAAGRPTSGRHRATTPTGGKEKAIFDEVAVISGWRPTLTGGAEPEPHARRTGVARILLRPRHRPDPRPHIHAGGRRAQRATGGGDRPTGCGAGGSAASPRRSGSRHAQRRAARNHRRAAADGFRPIVNRRRRNLAAAPAEHGRPGARRGRPARRRAGCRRACRSSARRRRPTRWPGSSRPRIRSSTRRPAST